MASTAEAIAAFWSWWSAANPRIGPAIKSGPRPDLVEEITGHVHAIDPGLGWEVGSGQRAEHSLCVTPQGKPELRSVTERWVRAGPPADAVWEYHPARPASLDAFGATLEIDGQQLDPGQTRLLLSVDEERQLIDVGVFHPTLRKLRKRTRPTVAFLVMDWLLGEDGVERWVGGIDVHVREPSGTVAAESLPEIVQALADRHPEPTWAVLQGFDRNRAPLLAVVRRPLKRIDWPLFDLHVCLTLGFAGRDAPDALEDLEDLQNSLEDLLGDQAVLVVRETRSDHRNLHLYCDSEGKVPDMLESWRSDQRLPVGVVWERDPMWGAVRQFQ